MVVVVTAGAAAEVMLPVRRPYAANSGCCLLAAGDPEEPLLAVSACSAGRQVQEGLLVGGHAHA